MNLKELKKEIPYKWKVQTAKEWGCECVAYIDARDVMDLLDEVVGPQNWQDRYEQVDGSLFCHLSIRIGEFEWITKSDCGMPSNMEAEKGEASDAFKRAAVKWGVGRFLYSLGTVRIKETICTNPKDDPKYRKYVPAHNGQRIYNVTAHVLQNNLYQPKQQAPTGNQPEKKTGYTPKPKATPSPEPEATQVQRDEINMLSNTLRWNGADFTAYLKQEKLNWDTLKKSEAHILINNLQAMVPKTVKADAADSQGMSTIGQREEIQDLCAKKNSGGKKFQDLLKEQGYTWAKLTYDQAEKVISILKAM